MRANNQKPVGRVVPVLWCAAVTFLSAVPVMAQQVTPADIDQLKALLSAQQKNIADQARILQEQGSQLRDQRRQIDAQQRELNQLRTTTTPRTAAAGATPVVAATTPSPQSVAQNPAPSRADATASSSTAISDPQAERERQRQQESRIVQSNPSLSRNSGVLTPVGTLQIEPSMQYEFITQREAVVSGFTIIPGITFGNLNIVKTDQRTLTAAVTARAGLTDRLEMNVRVPYVVDFGSTTTSNVGVNALPLTASASGYDIGDVEVGGSYQLNKGEEGWPIFVGNLQFKTITGRDPFSVPIYTINDANGSFLKGIQKQMPTGTGFYSLEPSVTMIYPSDPVILFANLRYINNFGRTVNVQNQSGGPGTPTKLDPGDGVGLNFGMGFALNDAASFSLGYEHVLGFSASSNGQTIGGSRYDLGTLTFGLGYQVNKRVSINLGVGVGVTPDTPAAKLLLSVPIKFDMF